MPEETNSTTTPNGEAPRNGGSATDAAKSAAAKLTAHPKVQQALGFAKSHPLGAVATVAAAAALVEIEFAVGILTGLGATALLASKSGPEAREQVIARGKEAREQVIARGKKAIEQARIAIAKRKKGAPSASSSTSASTTGESAPPPAA
jgi:hypothetical protein